MQKYIRCHIVEAEPMTRGDYNKHRGWEIPANENPADEAIKCGLEVRQEGGEE